MHLCKQGRQALREFFWWTPSQIFPNKLNFREAAI